MRFVFALILQLFFSAILSNINAQIVLKTEYFGKSSYRYEPTNEKVGDSKGSAAVYQGSVNIPLSRKMNEDKRPTIWGVSAGGAYVSLHNKNFTDDLVLSEIMNLNIALYHLRPLNAKWSLMASIGGGIFTPNTQFSKIKSDHMLGSAAAVLIRHLRPNLDLGGGLAFNNTFGYPMVFPALYLNWSLDGRYSVNVAMIDGLNISTGYRFNDYLSLSLIVEMNGQMAFVEKDNKDMVFTHQYIVIGFRPEIQIGKRVSIPITAGINATRSAYFNERKLKNLFKENSYYFQVSPYVSAGVKIGF